MLKKISSVFIIFLIAGCVAKTYPNNYLYPNTDPSFVEADFFPETSVGAYLAARYARKNLDYSSSADYFIKTLEKDEGNLIVLNNIYMLLVYAGRVNDAYPYALKAMETVSYSGTASIVAIVKNIADGDYDMAQKIISSVDDKGYNKFLIPIISAWVHFAKEEYEKAFAKLKPLKDTYEYNAIYHFHMGIMKDILGKNDEAKKHYDITLNGPGGSSLRAIDVIISFLLRTGDFDRAKEIFSVYDNDYNESFIVNKIAKHIASNEPYPRPIYDAKSGVAEALFGVAAMLTQGIGLEHSMFFIRLALHLDDEFFIAQMMLGNILELGELYEEANKIYQTIRTDSAAWLFAQIKMASNLNKLGQIDESISVLEKLRREYPNNININIEIGDILRINERYAEAIAPYSKAIDLINKNKKSEEAGYWTVYYARAIVYERSKKWELAEKDLIKALELENNQPYVLNYLAYSWLERRENVLKALDMLNLSHIQRPRDGYIADSLGWAYYI